MPYYTSVEARHREIAEREARIAEILNTHGKKLDELKQENKKKKKTGVELFEMLEITGMHGKILKPLETYIPRSYNLDRQITGLINHLFVKYPVPYFMYQACIKIERKGASSTENAGRVTKARFSYMNDLHKEWFLTLAQGGSFTKKVKGIMTSKEAHVFLNAPVENQIYENVWWAKLRVAGIDRYTTDKLINKIFSTHYFDDPNGRLAETINFYSHFYQEMDKATFVEVGDFLAWKLMHDVRFSLKGRTLSSVIKLSNEWHVEIQKAKLGDYITWEGYGIKPWLHETKNSFWEATELLNNHQLIDEGRKQKHCVSGYVYHCSSHRSAIVSLRQYAKNAAEVDEEGRIIYRKSSEEFSRLTIEVSNDGRIVQAKGKLNSVPDGEQVKILALWAGEKGYSSPNRWW